MSSTTITGPPKPRPYRRYLTSALHSRFVRAALLALLDAYFVSVWTGGSDIFWSVFPIGPAGLKAVLFSMSSLFIFILQVATLSVGTQTILSPYEFVRKTLVQFAAYQTVFWYTVSAYWFCEVYIWSVAEDKNLGWIIKDDIDSMDRLNERPIYLKFFFIVLAVVQSGMHLYHNYSSLHLPINEPASSQAADLRTHMVRPLSSQLKERLPHIGKNALLSSAITTLVAPFIYKAFFRNLFWQMHLAFAKPFFSLSRDDANPPETYFIGTILGAAFGIGVLLTFTWEFSALAFLAFLKQEPIRDGIPLSAASKDPNGTLLSGLAAKNDVVRSFAFWELAIIAQKYPDRRKAIFSDFERHNGPMWTSMHKTAIKVISEIDDRIIALQPSPPPPPPVAQNIQSLPRIAKDPRQQNIFAPMGPPSTRTQKIENFLAVTKTIGQSQQPWHPPIDQTKQQLIEFARSEVEHNKDLVTKYASPLATGVIGSLFRPKISFQIRGIILGSPTGNAAVIVDAIESTTKMLVASLNEDEYGKVVHTVPSTVKQFTRTISLMEGYIMSFTDRLQSQDEADLREVLIVLGRLKAGLRELLSAFQLFLNDVGIGIKDLNEAKKASEEREMISKPTPSQPSSANSTEASSVNGQISSESQPSQLDGGGLQSRRPEGKSTRRLEASKKQIHGNGNGNVFGARDPKIQSNRRREMEMVA